MCLGAIYWARPTSYYFVCTRRHAAEVGFDDDFIYTQMDLPPDKRSLPGHCLLAEEGLQPFVRWAQSLNKLHY